MLSTWDHDWNVFKGSHADLFGSLMGIRSITRCFFAVLGLQFTRILQLELSMCIQAT